MDDETNCTVCDGSGVDPDSDTGADCHLCEGAGRFGADGFPVSDDDDDN